MKHLNVESDHYNYLEKGFKEWLDVLGYAQRTVQGSPIQVRELFHHLEQNNITHITHVKARYINGFIDHLKHRSNLMHGGGLSTSSINSYISSLHLFAQYLNQTGKYELDIAIRRMETDTEERTVLTQKEIKALYDATFTPHRQNTLAIGHRDRAIIAVFYGCGLRKEEGTRLNVNDIDCSKRLLLVRKGKGNKQRYVPIAAKNYEDMRSYIEEGRDWFLQDNSTAKHISKGTRKEGTDDEAFFLNMEGKRMGSFYNRFAYLREKAEIEKEFSTHNLRHSIATHLLQSGMDIEEISKFLGHGSLESTQLYTHIVNKLKHDELTGL